MSSKLEEDGAKVDGRGCKQQGRGVRKAGEEQGQRYRGGGGDLDDK